MALENATYISSLNSSNPTSTDGLAQADDHIRLIKAVLQSTFPNINAAMTVTDEVLNGLDARLTTLEGDSSLPAPSGTKMLFRNPTAPTGWIQDTADNDKALRVTNTATLTSGGSQSFTTALASSRTITGSMTGTVAGHTLTIAQIPPHTHSITLRDPSDTGVAYNPGSSDDRVIGSDNTGSRGGGASHSHGFSGNLTLDPIAMDVQYIDVIVATKS